MDLGEYDTEDIVLTEAEAGASGDPGIEAQIEMERVLLHENTEPGGQVNFVEAAERAIPVLEESGDDSALARAWFLASWRGGALGDFDRGEDAIRRLSTTPAGRTTALPNEPHTPVSRTSCGGRCRSRMASRDWTR